VRPLHRSLPSELREERKGGSDTKLKYTLNTLTCIQNRRVTSYTHEHTDRAVVLPKWGCPPSYSIAVNAYLSMARSARYNNTYE
jgi:hypothetical protein